MPESQEDKENKIIRAVTPEEQLELQNIVADIAPSTPPIVVAPPSQPGVGAPTISEDLIDLSGIFDDQKEPKPEEIVDLSSALEESGYAISPTQTSTVKTDLTHIVKPQKLSDTAVEIYKVWESGNKWARTKAVEYVRDIYSRDALGRKGGNQEPQFNRVWMNFAYGTPQVLGEAIAETSADYVTNPISIGLMGWGKGMSMLAKSSAGQKAIKPFFKAVADYYTAKAPAFLRVDKSPIVEYITEPIGEGIMAKKWGAILKGGVTASGRAGVIAIEKAIDVIPEFVKKFTSYKYGLKRADAFFDRMKTFKRLNEEADKLAYEAGAPFWHGLSKEAQAFSTQVLEGKHWDEDTFERASFMNLEELVGMGIKEPQKFLKDLSDAKRLINLKALKLVETGLETGMLKEDGADIILNNLDKYLHRVYQMIDDPLISKKIATGEETLLTANGLVDNLTERLKNIGFTDDMAIAFNSLPQKEKIKRAKELGQKYIKKYYRGGPSVLSNALKKRRLEDQLEQRILGMKPPAYRIARTVQEQERIANNWRLFTDLSKETDWVSNKPGYMFTRVVGKKWGPLRNKYVHNEVLSDIEHLAGVHSSGEIYEFMNKAWVGLSSAFKFSKVPLSPAARQVNRFGNMIVQHFGGVPILKQPFLLEKARKYMKTGHPMYKKAVDNNLFATSFTKEELVKSMGTDIETLKASGILKQKIGLPLSRTIKMVGAGYEKDEHLYKFMKFIDEMEKHGDAGKAAKEALKWGLDYAKVSPLTRFLRSNPVYNIPFLSFKVLSFPLLVETALMNPIKLRTMAVLIGNINSSSLRSIGPTKEDIEYLRSKKGYFLIVPGVRTKTGKPMTVGINHILPFADLHNMLRHDMETTLFSQFEPGGPGILALESVSGRTLTGYDKEIHNKLEKKSIRFKKGIAHMYRGMLPGLMPTPDVLLKPAQSAFDFMMDNSDIGMPEIGPITFESANVRASGTKFQEISDAGYQLMTEALNDDRDAEWFRSVFAAKLNPEIDAESAMVGALASAIFGLNPQAIDENLLKYYDISVLNAFEPGGHMYSAFMRVQNDKRLTKEERAKSGIIFKNNYLLVKEKIINELNRLNLRGDKVRVIDNTPSNMSEED